MKKTTKSNKGFTLPELMLGLAVISIAAVFIFQAGVGIMNSQRSGSFHQLHNDLVTRISKFFSPTYDYTNLDMTIVAQGRLAPTQMVSSTTATNLKTPYAAASGDVSPVTGHPELFAITYGGLPRSTCAEDVITLSARSVAVYFTDGAAPSGSSPVAITGSPQVKNLIDGQDVDRAAVAQGCAGTGSGDASYGITFIQQ